MFIYEYILWIILYSFIGWIYETILCSCEEKRFVNRGFLYGPYCPIYGFGAILDIIILSSIKNIVILFFAGVIVTCSLEYFVSWLLEYLFHARWWDYSDMKFNIKGRVCLLGALVFGFFSVLLIKIIHPFFLGIIDKIPDIYLIDISLMLLTILILDIILTIIKLSEFNNKLKELQKYVENKILETNKNIKIHINEKYQYNSVKNKVKDLMSRLTQYDKRILKSFPRFRSTHYNEAVKKIREYLKK